LDEREKGIPKTNFNVSLTVTKAVLPKGHCTHVDYQDVKNFELFRMKINRDFPEELSKTFDGTMYIWRPDVAVTVHEGIYKLRNNKFALFVDKKQYVNKM